MKKDSIFQGILIGLIAPALAYVATTYTTIQQNLFSEKPIALYVIAALINLIIVRFTYRAGKESLAKGIVLATFLAMITYILVIRFNV